MIFWTKLRPQSAKCRLASAVGFSSSPCNEKKVACRRSSIFSRIGVP